MASIIDNLSGSRRWTQWNMAWNKQSMIGSTCMYTQVEPKPVFERPLSHLVHCFSGVCMLFVCCSFVVNSLFVHSLLVRCWFVWGLLFVHSSFVRFCSFFGCYSFLVHSLFVRYLFCVRSIFVHYSFVCLLFVCSLFVVPFSWQTNEDDCLCWACFEQHHLSNSFKLLKATSIIVETTVIEYQYLVCNQQNKK